MSDDELLSRLLFIVLGWKSIGDGVEEGDIELE